MKPKESAGRWNVAAGIFVLQIQLLVGTSIFFGKDCVAAITNVATSLGLDQDMLLRATQIGACSTLASCALFVAVETICSRRLSAFAIYAAPIAMACAEYAVNETISSAITPSILFVAAVVSLFYSKKLGMASSTLHVAIAATRDKPFRFIGTHCVAVLKLLYLLSWGVSAIGMVFWAANQKNLVPCQTPLHQHGTMESQNRSTFDSFASHETKLCEKPSHLYLGMIMFLIFILVWTMEVFKSWTHASASNDIGSWWTGRSPRQIRSLTRYLDYICQESLVISILGMFGTLGQTSIVNRRLMERFPRQQENTPTDSKPTYQHTRYLKSWYFVFLGIYAQNSTFTCDYAKAESQLDDFGHLRDNRFVFFVVFLCKLSIAMISGCLARVADHFLQGDSDISSPLITVGLAFVAAFVAGSAMLTSLEGAAKTILVCFSESFPEDDFNKTRLAFELKNASQQAYPRPCLAVSNMLEAAKRLSPPKEKYT